MRYIKEDDIKRSKYHGVTWRNGKWRARITVDGKTHSLGYFADEKDAAIAYDSAQRRLRGPKAKKFNFAGLKVLASHLLRLDEPIWTSTDGRKTPISLLANPHLLNIERRLRYKGATMPDEGEQSQWYVIISNEMFRRGLEKLPDHPNQDLETAEIPVYYRTLRSKKPNGLCLVDITALPVLQRFVLIDDRHLDKRQHTPYAFIDQGKDGLSPYLSLPQIITGVHKPNVKIRHQNGNERDCRRVNLLVDGAPDNFKVYKDNHRGRLGPQADAALEYGEQTDTAKQDFFYKGPRRPVKGDIRTRLTPE